MATFTRAGTRIEFTDIELQRLHFIVESYAEIAPDEVANDDGLREVIAQAFYSTEAGQASTRALDEIIEALDE